MPEPSRGLLQEKGVSHSRYPYDPFTNDVPALLPGSDLATYRKMRRGDSTVSAVMRSIELPIRRATYDVQPPSEPTSLETQQAKVISDSLFEYLPWSDILKGCITYPTLGFSIHEFTLERRRIEGKSYILPRKIAFRPQGTITEEYKDNRDKRGELLNLTQTVDGKRYILPRKKLIICTADAESREDWRGTSVLHSAYRSWFIKEKMEIINAIAHERWGAGIPVLELPELKENQTLSEVEETVLYQAAVVALKALHAGEQSYAVMPPGYKLYVLDRKGTVLDALAFIKELKDDIKTAPLALHLRLGGNDSSGSKALGVAFVDSFLHAVEAWANVICDAFSHDMIRPIVDINWGKQLRYPKMAVTNIYKTVVQDIAYLIQSGVIKSTPELVRFIFEQYGIKLDNPEEAMPDSVTKNNNSNNQNNNQDNDDEEDEDKEDGN